MTTPTTQTILEYGGVFLAAITGVLAGQGKRIDLFGVLVLALVTSFGGGTVRDVLAGDLPAAWLRGPGMLLTVVAATLLTFFVSSIRRMPRRALLVADAFALSLFTIMGTRKGLLLGFSAPISVFFGVVTGVTGGILRDVLTGEVPLVFRPDINLYATASLCGAALFVGLHGWGFEGHMTTVLSAAVVLAMRLAGIYWKLTLPVYEG